jgi:5-formyltetrahydrofolate cyclo-ligase
MVEPAPPSGRAKATLRARLLAGRRTMPARTAGDAARTAALLAHPLLAAAGTIAAYASFGTEPDTAALRRELAARGTTVLLPQVHEDGGLSFRCEDGAVRPISAAELLLVPALAVDSSGMRLGRGGGSYDRVLAGVRVPVLALLHPGELLARVPAEPHDQPVTGVALPGGIAWLAPVPRHAAVG